MPRPTRSISRHGALTAVLTITLLIACSSTGSTAGEVRGTDDEPVVGRLVGVRCPAGRDVVTR